MKRNLRKKLTELLKELHLPMFREYHAEYAVKAMSEGLSYEQYLFELAQIECDVRRANKIIRLIKASKLPMEKTLENFDLKRLPLRIRLAIPVVARRICCAGSAMNWPGKAGGSTSAPVIQ
jgi:DNA replication protein DnaC